MQPARDNHRNYRSGSGPRDANGVSVPENVTAATKWSCGQALSGSMLLAAGVSAPPIRAAHGTRLHRCAGIAGTSTGLLEV